LRLSNAEIRGASIQLSPIHVLHLASGDLWAGAEVQVYNMVRRLSCQPGFEVQAVLMNEGRLSVGLKEAGVKVTVLDEHRLGFPKLLSCLTKLLKQRRVHILHAHRYKENILGALAAKLAGIPYIVSTIHGLPEPVPRGSVWRARFASLANRIALGHMTCHLIAVSEDIASFAKKLAPGRVSVVGNSVCLASLPSSTDRNILLQSLGIPPGHKVVGAVGRLNHVKGMDLFLECAIQLVKARDDLSCLVVGQGPERSRLETYICRNGGKDRIILAGFRQNIHEIIDLFDVLVIPSRHEGVPTVLLEALALGKAVVATAVGGIPEVIEHNVNGLLVLPDDTPSWIPVILFLLDNPMEARRLGACGQKDVAERWSIDRQARQLCDIYRRLLRDTLL